MDGLCEEPGDDPPLAIAERALPTIGKDFLDGLAGGGLDLRIRIEERQTEARREAAADLALSGPHKTDQDYGSARREPPDFCGFPIRSYGADLHPTLTALFHRLLKGYYHIVQPVRQSAQDRLDRGYATRQITVGGMGKITLALIIVIALLLLGGGAFLALWNPPAPSAPVEKVIPDARFPK